MFTQVACAGNRVRTGSPRNGIAFPGRWLNRIAHDHAPGSAGIGLFLSRLVSPGERAFADL
ncbi:hypothetical protein ACFVZ8_01955 [Streptomyces sp. NPDC059558]|uniref:hypothetical protein n=1 Tax=unclassified Streptomyces TaxID=2593676 RepID=UPI001331626A|nr:hypothetical protein [Streptomyces sp. Sge12]